MLRIVSAQDDYTRRRKQAKHSYERPNSHAAFRWTSALLAKSTNDPERAIDQDGHDGEHYEHSQDKLTNCQPTRNTFHRSKVHSGLDKATFLVWCQQLERGNRFGWVLLGNATELRTGDGKICLIPSSQRSEKELAVLEANPANASQTFHKVKNLGARRIRLVPTAIFCGAWRQGCHRRQGQSACRSQRRDSDRTEDSRPCRWRRH